MKVKFTILFFCGIFACFSQNKLDTIFIYDEFAHSEVKVSVSDYLKQVDLIFKDSLKYSIKKYFNDSTENNLIPNNYFVDFDYYDYTKHPILFDKVILDLLKEGKLVFVKSGIEYNYEKTKIKTRRVYRCGNFGMYIGKDFIVYSGQIELGSFIKFRNRKAYWIVSCF